VTFQRPRAELETLRARGFRLNGGESDRLEDAEHMDAYSCPDCGAWFAAPNDAPDVMRAKREAHRKGESRCPCIS
jgi:hypothetical protein